MKVSMLLCLALAIAPAPVFAQDAAPPPMAAPPDAPNPQAFAAMRQSRGQLEQLHVELRTRLLAALTPAHRTMLANAIGGLALSANPNPRAVAASLDTLLAPGEKQSILALDAAARSSAHAIMRQQRAAFESTMTADQKAKMAAREAKMAAFRQSHPRPAYTPDAGMIALRTLGSFGGREMGFGHGRPPGA